MKYLLLVYSSEASWTADEWHRCVELSSGICQELAAKCQLHSASPLYPVATAKTVRVRAGQRIITDGPFTETKEQLGGYFLIDVDNLDEAIAIASRLPAAKKGTIEIRPLFTLEGLPHVDPAAATAAGPSDSSSDLRRFIMLCYDDEAAWEQAGPEALNDAMQRAVALAKRLHAQGRFVYASPLRSPSMATSVRIRQERRHVTDGPFMETREVLGGFYVILARDHTDAINVGAQHSGAEFGAVEVRELHDLSRL